MGVIAIGDVSMRETSASGSLATAGSKRISLAIKGIYDEMNAMMPAKGDHWAGKEGFIVDTATLDHGEGGSGTARIELVEDESVIPATNEALSDLLEIDWRPVEKPILSNPIYLPYIDQFIDIELWRNESNATYRKAFQYQNGVDDADPPAPVLVTLSSQMQAVAALILKGVESYMVFAPIVIRTRTYRRRKTFGGAGFLEIPSGAPPVYKFLKTGDNWKQQDDKTWQRREEWTGGDSIEESLYVAGVST
jgi:hypothetical protein